MPRRPGTDWPAAPPRLGAADLCGGVGRRGRRRDLGGWLEESFPEPLWEEVYAALYAVFRAYTDERLAAWEVSDDYEPADVAALWNEAMRRLGYPMGGRQRGAPGGPGRAPDPEERST